MLAFERFNVIDTSDPDAYFETIREVRPSLSHFEHHQSNDRWNVRMNSLSLDGAKLSAMSSDGYSFSGAAQCFYVATPVRGLFNVNYDRKNATVNPGSSFIHVNDLNKVTCQNYRQFSFATSLDDFASAFALLSSDDPRYILKEIEGRNDQLDFSLYHYNLKHVVSSLDRTPQQLLDIDRFLRSAKEMLLFSVAQSLLGETPEKSTGRSAVFLKRAIEFITANLQHEIRIRDIAAFAGCSIRLLQVLFRQQLNQTIVQYITTCRLDLARRLLLSASVSENVTDIAFQCGFNHLGLFAKQYGTAFGETPSKTLGKRTGSRRPSNF
jgi:hypothetical protein